MPVKRLTGKIISDKMQKTVIVAVDMPKKHSVYEKPIKNTRKLKARNDVGAVLGETVLIEEGRKLGKTVSWKVIKKA